MLDPAPPVPRIVSDKTLHFASFFVMSFAAIGFCRGFRQLLATGGLCLLAGVVLETAQLLVPSRGFEWADMAANLGGVLGGTLLAGLILAVLRRRRPRRRRSASGRAAFSGS